MTFAEDNKSFVGMTKFNFVKWNISMHMALRKCARWTPVTISFRCLQSLAIPSFVRPFRACDMKFNEKKTKIPRQMWPIHIFFFSSSFWFTWKVQQCCRGKMLWKWKKDSYFFFCRKQQCSWNISQWILQNEMLKYLCHEYQINNTIVFDWFSHSRKKLSRMIANRWWIFPTKIVSISAAVTANISMLSATI